MGHEQTLLQQIRELQFTIVELNLFLDTHPAERQALTLFDQVNRELQSKIERYQQTFGPLTVRGRNPGGNCWEWTEGPWPWETTC
jgi:spore coat protein JB